MTSRAYRDLNDAIYRSDLTRAEKRVLLYINRCGGTREGGQTTCSLDSLAARIDLSRMHVTRCVARLEELGWLSVIRRPGAGRCNTYQVRLPRVLH